MKIRLLAVITAGLILSSLSAGERTEITISDWTITADTFYYSGLLDNQYSYILATGNVVLFNKKSGLKSSSDTLVFDKEKQSFVLRGWAVVTQGDKRLGMEKCHANLLINQQTKIEISITDKKMKVTSGGCVLLEDTDTDSAIHAKDNMEPPETAEDQDPEELIFLGESAESLFAILSVSRSKQVKSLCIRELSGRGMENIQLLKKKISRESTDEEQDFAAEILLHIDNTEAKNLACKYYVSQLANSLYVYKNYYHYPSTVLQAGDIKKDIIVDGKKFRISLIPAAATIPLLELKEIALPHLVKNLDDKYDNIIPALNAYWLIENILKKELPPFGEVWQNADIVKKIIHDSTDPQKDKIDKINVINILD